MRNDVSIFVFGECLADVAFSVGIDAPDVANPFAVFVVLSGYTFTVTLFVAKQSTLVHIFFQAAVQLILLVPLITMRQFAEERRNGTLQLLLTSPVREIEIVAAKFLACMTLLAAMTGMTLVYALILAIYGTPDWGPIYRAMSA